MVKNIGPINSIVLSRSAGADNVYLQDTQSIQTNGLCEIKIEDNQIMNDNNRSDYLTDLLSKLGGIEYYINDFSSTGICYYDIFDMYNIQIDSNTYNCIMLNDEINVTDGLEEIIYCKEPEQTKTEYEKADKTDRKINQTYFLVDKQNQTINGLITNFNEQNTRLAEVMLNVDELNTKIQEIADITTSSESTQAIVELTGINASEPIMLKIHPITTNISYLYPILSGLYPSNTQYLPDRKIKFTNTTTNEVIYYELPDDLLYYNSENYDEFYLNYETQTCQITKKCKYNADGTVGLLSEAVINTYTYPTIVLENDGNYTIEISGYNIGYISATLVASNIYTSQFATKVEMDSVINQTAQSINLSVNQKLTNYSTTNQMNSAITIKANEITSSVSNNYETKTSAQYNYSLLQQTDSSISSAVATKVGNNEIISKINQSPEAVTINANKISLEGKNINLTSDNMSISSTNFSVDKNGNVNASNANISGTINSSNVNITGGNINIPAQNYANGIKCSYGSDNTYMYSRGIYVSSDLPYIYLANLSGNNVTSFGSGAGMFKLSSSNYTNINGGTITANSYNYISKESKKKNIKKYNKKAIKIVKNSDIYEYHYKSENNTDKKHIGFVIGDLGGKYRTPDEVISKDGNGINSYSTLSILWKAVQEQQKEIEELKQEILKLKGKK